MLQQEQTRVRQTPAPSVEARPREVFPYLNGLKNSISDGERLEKKEEVLRNYTEAIVELNQIARSLKELGSLKEQIKNLESNSKELSALKHKVEDNILTIRQNLGKLQDKLPETGWLKLELEAIFQS